MSLFDKIFGSYSAKELARIEPIKQKVLDLDEEYQGLSDESLKAKTVEFRQRLADGESLDDIMPEALATVREAADRILGKKPFPVQIIGAIVLHQGRIAEMRTGEGKTLVACVASYVNGLTGDGVPFINLVSGHPVVCGFRGLQDRKAEAKHQAGERQTENPLYRMFFPVCISILHDRFPFFARLPESRPVSTVQR